MEKVKIFIRKYLWWTYRPIKDRINRYRKDNADYKKYLAFDSLKPGGNKVFYFGITIHRNLGDLAQRYCITKWIKENYPHHELVMVESDVIVNNKLTSRFFNHLREIYGQNDFIILQSGYCTQDLGGNHPLMHRLVCEYMPEARILMMPQTIFFQNEENRRICAENHNKAKNMLFLARDFVSFEQAKQMFPAIKVEAYPDIVTTLIGTMTFHNPRTGVCLCTRNDGEKLYSEEQIDNLEEELVKEGIQVKKKDTQSSQTLPELVANLQHYITAEIESYSHYEVTITDRYHGTIFSLCAGTPVVIIKTNDHKVTTGADWFKGVYDDYVYVAVDLEDAHNKAKEIMSRKINHQLAPYFKERYYDKLKDMFEVGRSN